MCEMIIKLIKENFITNEQFYKGILIIVESCKTKAIKPLTYVAFAHIVPKVHYPYQSNEASGLRSRGA